MPTKLDALEKTIKELLADASISVVCALNELTVDVPVANWPAVASTLCHHASLSFEACIDLCGIDYSTYQDGLPDTGSSRLQVGHPQIIHRFAVIYHLLSVKHNQRLRVRVFCVDDDMPAIPSMLDVWAGLNWFEREAFDLYGIVFVGHPDLRRILTDYGFVGHPFRKDFPLSGYVEMRYDPIQERVIYQPVSIDPREVTPRIVREENYGG